MTDRPQQQTWEERWHPLREEWVIVAAHRQSRPWLGETVRDAKDDAPEYAGDCYLCPGNARVSGATNPRYEGVFVFDNDHPCVGPLAPSELAAPPGIYRNRPASGVAAEAKLGVTVTHQDMAFGSLITSLQSGRIDLTMAGMNDTKARQAQIDFVDYFTSGITIMIRKGNPDGITGPDTLCGKNVAVVQGTSHQKFAAEQSTKCTQQGKPAITVTATDSDNQNQNQLRTGRVQAILNDLPSAVYISRTAGDGKFFEVVPGEPIDGGPYGIGVNKANTTLRDAVQKALQALITDGTYGKILQAWGVEQGAIKEAAVNGGS